MHQKYQSHRLRTGRVSIVTTAYHLRFSVTKPNRAFIAFHVARVVVKSIAQEHAMCRAENLCFCVMPDHVHWLMILKKGSIGQSVHNIKRLSNHLSGCRIPWQRGYFDHGIRNHENLKQTARYIVANPLRAGLVSTLGDYPHWDAAWLYSDFDLSL